MADMPDISYVTTSDGVNIAYVAEGTGPVVVDMIHGMPFSPIQGLEISEEDRSSFATRCQIARTVFFEPRGMGYSDRNVTDFSIDALTRDVAAVVEAVDQGTGVWLMVAAHQRP
jgi:pimeloyl-ACP methyl ester carboxylesterase